MHNNLVQILAYEESLVTVEEVVATERVSTINNIHTPERPDPTTIERYM